MNSPSPFRISIIRILVRRHCADLIAEGVATEPTLIAGLLRCTELSPDIPLGRVAQAFHDTCWEMWHRQQQKKNRAEIRELPGEKD
jgi:hypothetical protein